jgi:RHS repeat-associated protein
MYTDKLFTGQREMTGLGIYHYGARFYSPKLGRFLSADTIVQSYANPQTLNRYSYVLGNPLRYTDPTGHTVACDPYEDDCHDPDPAPPPVPSPAPDDGGNCNNDPDCLVGDSVPPGWDNGVYCIETGCYFDGGTNVAWTLEDWPTIVAAVLAACTATGLCVAIGTAALAGTESAAYTIYYNAVLTCLKVTLCASAIGAGGGVTVLGKIIPGQNPPGYVELANQINGRVLYTPTWTPALQAQFMEETKALGNPVFLANNPNLYPGSVLAAEANDLLNAGWTMILNTLMYPPK